MPLLIRTETPADIAAIEQLTAAAFQNAPHSSHTEQFIVNALRCAGQLSVSLVAQQDNEIVGHVAVSPVSISSGATDWYGLGPTSVAPDQQGKGIGSQLMKSALAELQRLGAAGCVVLGDPAYYGRFGFRVQPGLVLPGVPSEYFQAVFFRASKPVGHVTITKRLTPRSDDWSVAILALRQLSRRFMNVCFGSVPAISERQFLADSGHS